MIHYVLQIVPITGCSLNKQWHMRTQTKHCRKLYQITWKVTWSVYCFPFTSIVLFMNSTPMVWKLWSSKWLEMNLLMRHDFPTPPSPSITIFSKVFRFGVLLYGRSISSTIMSSNHHYSLTTTSFIDHSLES